jgi:hypothetical protein
MRFSLRHLIALSLGIKANWARRMLWRTRFRKGVFRWICAATYFEAHPKEVAGHWTRSVYKLTTICMAWLGLAWLGLACAIRPCMESISACYVACYV